MCDKETIENFKTGLMNFQKNIKRLTNLPEKKGIILYGEDMGTCLIYAILRLWVTRIKRQQKKDGISKKKSL